MDENSNRRARPRYQPVRPANPTPAQEAEYLRLKKEWDEMEAERDRVLLKAQGGPALPDDGDE